MNWIDVNEKLPEVGIDSVYGSEWVLVAGLFDGNQYVSEGKYVATNRPYWKSAYDDKIQVTHWMPLPKPPILGV